MKVTIMRNLVIFIVGFIFISFVSSQNDKLNQNQNQLEGNIFKY